MSRSMTCAGVDLAQEVEFALSAAVIGLRDGAPDWLSGFERAEALLSQLRDMVVFDRVAFHEPENAPQLRAALKRMRVRVGRAQRLLEQAAVFHAGLAGAGVGALRESAEAYTSSGAPPAARRPVSRWRMEG